MRRLIIFDEYRSSLVNGVGTFVRNLISMMPRDRFDVSLVNMNGPVDEFAVRERADLTTYDFPPVNGGDFMGAATQIAVTLSLHLPDSDGNVFVINHSPCYRLLKALKRYYRRSKFVFIIHNQGWNSPLLGNEDFLKSLLIERKRPREVNPGLAKFLRDYVRDERRAYALFDAVVSLSGSTSRILEDIYRTGMENVHLIPNGVAVPDESELIPTEEAKRRLGIDPQDTVLLYSGRIAESKGVVPLVRAFARLTESHPGLRLLIAGPGQGNFMETLDVAVRSRISVLGHVPPEEMDRLYDAADICVMPSFTEQCSYVALELMSRRKLIVTSDVVGQRDIFREGENAVMFRHWIPGISPVDSLVNAIGEALSLPKEMKAEFIERNLALLKDEFSIETQCRSLTDMIESLPDRNSIVKKLRKKNPIE